MLAVLALALCAASPEARPPSRPTSGAMRRAFEAGRAAVVDVESARGKGLGILVGSGGEVLTSVQFVELQSARVRAGDTVHPASVRFAQADLGIALVAIQAPGPFQAAAVRPGEAPVAGYVVGVERGRKGARVPRLGRIRRPAPRSDGRFLEIDLAIGAGSPLLDVEGRLVGIVVAKTARGGSRAVAIPTLREILAGRAR